MHGVAENKAVKLLERRRVLGGRRRRGVWRKEGLWAGYYCQEPFVLFPDCREVPGGK